MTSPAGHVSRSAPLPRRTRLLALLILALTVVSFSPVFDAGFTNWDDQEYVVANTSIRALNGTHIAQAFSSTMLGHYQPLVFLSYAIDYAVGGLSPVVYHGMSLFLHLINIMLVALLVWRLSGNSVVTLTVCALFALHPLHVEPVAWISSRKDVLFTLFYLGGLVAFLHRRSDGGAAWYAASFVLFILACMSKSMAVTFPVVLLLLDWQQRKSIRWNDVWSKIPFFAASLVFGILSVITQLRAHALRSDQGLTLLDNILVGMHGIVFYFWKALVPVGLSAFYPYPETGGMMPLAFILSPLIVVAIAASLFLVRKWMRFALFGGLFYVTTLLPVLQFIPVGGAVAADRYSYLPLVGLFLIAGELWSLARDRARQERRAMNAWIAVSIVVPLLLAAGAYQRSGVWKTSSTLWTDVLAQSPNLGLALFNRAEAYREAGDWSNAIADYGATIQADSTNALAYNNRGNLFLVLGDTAGAIRDYSSAVRTDTNFAQAWVNRGNVLHALGELREALSDFDRAVSLTPDRPLSYWYRARAAAGLGESSRALDDLERAIRLGLDDYDAWMLDGRLLYREGRFPSAAAAFSRALKLRDNALEAIVFRAYAFLSGGNIEAARADVRAAQQLGHTFDPKFLAALAVTPESR